MDILAVSEDARVVPHLQAIGAVRLTQTSWRLCVDGKLEILAGNVARRVPPGAEFLLAEVVGCATRHSASSIPEEITNE